MMLWLVSFFTHDVFLRIAKKENLNRLAQLLCTHEMKFCSCKEKNISKEVETLTIVHVLWFIFYVKNSIFSLTHDLSHEILYAFGSVIKLICHFPIIFVGGKQKTKPAKRHLSSWWIIRVTSSLFKWNLKGLVKMITTIFHRPDGRNIFSGLWFLLFLSSRKEMNREWQMQIELRLFFGQFIAQLTFRHLFWASETNYRVIIAQC